MTRLTTGLCSCVLLSITSATFAFGADIDGNRQWLREQEKYGADLHKNAQVPSFLNNQTTPALPQADQSFIDRLVEKKRKDAAAPPAQGALYLVSFSIPEEGLKRMLHESKRFAIPATLRGMVNNDMRETVSRVQALVTDGQADGVQIDPQPFQTYGITAVPALIVRCDAGADIVLGNLRIESALRKMAKDGDCATTAQKILEAGGVHD